MHAYFDKITFSSELHLNVFRYLAVHFVTSRYTSLYLDTLRYTTLLDATLDATLDKALGASPLDTIPPSSESLGASQPTTDNR